MSKKKVGVGRLVATVAVMDWLEEKGTYAEVALALTRHVQGDWDDVCESDKKLNDRALENGERVLSSHTIKNTVVWIITEWDRSVTTVLFPEDY